MSIETTVTIRAVCHCCGDSGKCQASLDGGKTFIGIACPECHGEGVSEQQISIREFRHMLEADAKARRAERGDWHADPIEEAEVRDAEQS